MKIHQISSKLKFWKLLGQFFIGHLQMMLMFLSFLMNTGKFIKFLVCSTILMVNHNNLSELMKIKTNTHMVKQSLAPMRKFSLSQSQTCSCQYELIIIIVITIFIHEMSHIINESKVHTSNKKAFSMVRCQLVLGFHQIEIQYNRYMKFNQICSTSLYLNWPIQTKVMIQQNSQKRPLSPQQLFNKLINQDYRELECQDSKDKYMQQRTVLIELIAEYQRQIEGALLKLQQQSRLRLVRQELISDLQTAKRERQIIQHEISSQINRVKLTALEVQEKNKLQTELLQIRNLNVRTKIKLRDLYDYVQKLQIQNKKLQDQRRIIQSSQLNRLRVDQDGWRTKIENLKNNQSVYENQMRMRMKQKEDMILREVKQQENQIFQRNRKRMQSFKLGVISSQSYPVPQGYNFDRFRVI